MAYDLKHDYEDDFSSSLEVWCGEGAWKKVQSSVQMVQCVQPGSRAACMQGACRCSVVHIHLRAVDVCGVELGGAEARQDVKGCVSAEACQCIKGCVIGAEVVAIG